ncbi:MAG: hypothetical protein WCW84_10505 [Sulfurimonas sp.]|jgi:hypothetical protein
MQLITATECVNRLRQAGIFKGKLPYFIQLANGGFIPYHPKPNSSKRWYRYEEAKQALKDMEDPSREPQREANERKRKPEPIKEDTTPQQITEILTKIYQFESLHPEMFDRSKLEPNEAETFDDDIKEMNGENGLIRDLTGELLNLLDEMSGGSFRSSKAELRIVEFLDKWISTPDRVREFYGIV